MIITIYNYFKDIIDNASFEIFGTIHKPAKPGLFTVDKSSPLLNEKGVDFFPGETSRLLFAAEELRVRVLTISNYKKLTRVIQYLCVPVYLLLMVGLDKSGTLLWSINASFAVHSDTKSHIGAMLTFDKGAVFSMSNKHRVNSTCSTVAKITVIGVDNAMNFVI